jgi:hypothetical protein
MVIEQTEAVLFEKMRREVYAALVDGCGPCTSPHRSRINVAGDYGLTYEQVAAIEREGIEKDWEPG